MNPSRQGLSVRIVGFLSFKVVILAGIIGLVAGCLTSTLTLPMDAKAVCAMSKTDFDSWFQSGTASVNGVVNPADSVNFPNVPNCSFYQWSEHMFLWLTSPAPVTYGGGARIFDSPTFFDVSPPDAAGDRNFIAHVPGQIRFFNLRDAKAGPHGLPVTFDRSGRMLEILRPVLAPNGNPLILNNAGQRVEVSRITVDENKRPRFFGPNGEIIRTPKPIIENRLLDQKSTMVQRFRINGVPIFIDPAGNVVDVEQGQAGGGDVLEAQNGSLIYYATMVNDVYAYFLTGVKDNAITPGGQFPTTQGNLNQIIAFASAHGKTFPDPNALAIEVKSSWVEAAGLPNLNNYITMSATVPTYDRTNPDQWVPNGQKNVELALVGMHVVGSTAGHPEMIWATFEHSHNAPVADYTYINTNNQTVTQSQDVSGNWLFCTNANNSTLFNQSHMFVDTPDIKSNAPFTISPSDTIRWKAWGAAVDHAPNPASRDPITNQPTTAASDTEIISINNSVRGMLTGSDVRSNYILAGATWTIGGASPSGSFPSGNEVGTSRLCNATLETYQQGTSNQFSSGVNCFACHTSNTTGISHIFFTEGTHSGGLKPLF